MRQRLRNTVATNLKRIRKVRGFTQEELAHRAGINRNYPGMIERLEHSPTIDVIERLCRVLKIDPIELFKRD